MRYLLKKSELDKFYTKPKIAQQCVDSLSAFSNIELWLEPSAGAGVFLSRLPEPKVGLDLEPDSDDILQQDFFTYKAPNKHIAVVGNPPFGRNSSLAIKFFNYAATFADIIAFIVPKTFRKISVQNKLSLDFILLSETELPLESFDLINDNGFLYSYSVPCVWQIWVRGKRDKIVLPTSHADWHWCSKEDANYAIRRVGGLAGKCYKEFSNYSPSSNYFIKTTPEVYERLDSLYTNFQDVAKNTAGNPSLSKSELVYIYTRKYK